MNSPNMDPIVGSVSKDEDDFGLNWNQPGFNMDVFLHGEKDQNSSWLDESFDEEMEQMVEDMMKKGEVCDGNFNTIPEMVEGKDQMKVEVIDQGTIARPFVVPTPAPSFSSDVSYGSNYEQHDLSPKEVSTSASRRPRKYSLKPAEVKRQPEYKDKRNKNNDAVRRCREKTKRKQEEKDQLLVQLQEENQRLAAENEELKNTLAYAHQNCQCGILMVVPE